MAVSEEFLEYIMEYLRTVVPVRRDGRIEITGCFSCKII